MPDCHPTWELFLPQPVAKFHWKIPRCRGSTRTKSIVPDHDTRHPPDILSTDGLWWGGWIHLGPVNCFFDVLMIWREWRTLGSFLFEEDLAFKISFRWFGCVFLFTHCNHSENGNLNIQVFKPSFLRGRCYVKMFNQEFFFWWNNFIHVLAMNEEYHRFLLSTCQLKKRPTSMSCFFLTCWPKWPKFAATNVLSPSVPTSTRRAKVQSEICLGKGRVRRMFACPRSG